MPQSPPEPLSPEALLSAAKESGIAIPPTQAAGVLDGARNLQRAAERLRVFLAEQRS